MTILSNANNSLITSEKRSHATSNIDEDNNDSSINANDTDLSLKSNKRAKTLNSSSSSFSSPSSSNVSLKNGSLSPKEDFTSKMIIQLVKSAIASLDGSYLSSENINKETPLESLANSISLPSSNANAFTTQNLVLLINQLTSEIARFDNLIALPLLKSILRINWIYHSSNNDSFNKHYATFLTVLVSTIPSWWKEVATKIITDFIKSSPKNLLSHHETLKKLISIAPTAANSLPDLIKANFPNKTAPKNEIINYTKNILYITEYYDVLMSYVWKLIFEKFITLDVELQNQIDEIDDDDLSDALGLDDDSDNEANSDSEDTDDDDEIDGVDSDSDDDLMEISNEGTHNKANYENIDKSYLLNQNKNDDDENDDDDDDDEEAMGNYEESDVEYSLELESVSDLANKLDSLLTAIFHYLKPKLSIESLESGTGITTFNALTSVFRSMILPTHGSRAAQYILFYAAQQQPELIDAFIVTLFEIVFSDDGKNTNPTLASIFSSFSNSSSRGININTKITASQYIASFVARGNKLSDAQIVSVVGFLVKYCNAYIEEIDDINDEHGYNNKENNKKMEDSSVLDSNSEFNPTKHSLFYSLVQTLMYIVCFRKDALREKTDDISNKSSTGWVAQLDKFFTRVIVSKYDPLRWCNETVVLIFSRVAQSEGICYTWSVVERIRRERVGRTNSALNEMSLENSNNSTQKTKDSNSRETTPVSQLATSQSSHLTIGTLAIMRATQEFMDLVAVFPFDPLLLKKSRNLINDYYLEWDNGDDDESE